MGALSPGPRTAGRRVCAVRVFSHEGKSRRRGNSLPPSIKIIQGYPRGCAPWEDNAAMIGCQGYYEYLAGNTAGWDLNARASLDISKDR